MQLSLIIAFWSASTDLYICQPVLVKVKRIKPDFEVPIHFDLLKLIQNLLDQNHGHLFESMGPKREGPIPQWGPSPLGPRPSCLSSLLDSSTGWAPPRLPHNPEKEVDVGRANWISRGRRQKFEK